MPERRTRELLDDLVTRLHHLPRRKLTLLVGVGGSGAEARDHFVDNLSTRDREIITVAMSDFQCPQPDPQAGLDGGSDGNRIDWRRLRGQVLLPLQRNLTAAYQRSGPGLAGHGPWCQVPVGGIVVIHGPAACMKQLAHAYDFQIWVEAALGLSPPAEAGREPFLDKQTEIETADLVVDGSPSLGLDPTREYIRIRL